MFLHKKLNFLALGGDLHQALGDESVGSHGAQILALTGTDRNGAVFHIPVTDDQHIGDLLHLGLTDLVAQLFAAVVAFGMEYTDADGQKKTPYIIHRTSLGCYERTLAYLIERYAGALPLWMMPTQVKVLPITDRAHEYAKELSAKLNSLNIHAETDCRSEKLGYKIREAQLQKIPYMLVIGDRDMENGTVSVRTRKGDDLGAMTPDEFIAKCLMEIATKSKEV